MAELSWAARLVAEPSWVTHPAAGPSSEARLEAELLQPPRLQEELSQEAHQMAELSKEARTAAELSRAGRLAELLQKPLQEEFLLKAHWRAQGVPAAEESRHLQAEPSQESPPEAQLSQARLEAEPSLARSPLAVA